MREVARIVVAVIATDLLLRAIGLWSWISSSGFGRWPWLADRYALLFPLTLVIAVLILRRWKPTRTYLLSAGLIGAGAGTFASVTTLGLAQVLTAPERANFWNGLQLEGGVTGFLLFGCGIALFRALGWLYGSLAASLTLLTERAERRLFGSREQPRSPRPGHRESPAKPAGEP